LRKVCSGNHRRIAAAERFSRCEPFEFGRDSISSVHADYNDRDSFPFIGTIEKIPFTVTQKPAPGTWKSPGAWTQPSAGQSSGAFLR
jgi:hypothetical protein